MKRYRLYFDESGDHTYQDTTNPAKRYLCLLGLFIEVEGYRTSFHPEFEKLKQDNFPHSPDEPLVLHRKELINRVGPFARLRQQQNQERFNNDLLAFLERQDYKLVGVVMDKKTHIDKYGSAAYHPYFHCLAALLERYCGFLNFYNVKGDVLGESRGGTEDSELKKAYRTLLTSGTLFRAPMFFRGALTSGEIKLKPKAANIAGLQVAYLLAYPVKQGILVDRRLVPDPGDVFGKDVLRVISAKYNRHIFQGRVQGYSQVFLG